MEAAEREVERVEAGREEAKAAGAVMVVVTAEEVMEAVEREAERVEVIEAVTMVTVKREDVKNRKEAKEREMIKKVEVMREANVNETLKKVVVTREAKGMETVVREKGVMRRVDVAGEEAKVAEDATKETTQSMAATGETAEDKVWNDEESMATQEVRKETPPLEDSTEVRPLREKCGRSTDARATNAGEALTREMWDRVPWEMVAMARRMRCHWTNPRHPLCVRRRPERWRLYIGASHTYTNSKPRGTMCASSTGP